VRRRRLCRLEDIPDGQARGFTLDRPEGPQDIFIYRAGATARAFVNSCPHQGTPLDWVADQFIAPDGEHFLCATHGALFATLDGTCIAGPCLGDRLQPVAVAVEDGWVTI
jgi:naringenin degradation protein FdeD